MKKQTINWIILSIGIELLLILSGSCKKKDNNTNPPDTNNCVSSAIFNSNKTYGALIDIDGNKYKTITIGSQTWMAENLRTTKYRNGDPIEKANAVSAWRSIISGAYCNFLNTDNCDTIVTYGRLYNWYAMADSRNVAPPGWHVPTHEDWITLITYLGGEDSAGVKLKESSTIHWSIPNTSSNNETGFTALPGGFRGDQGWYYPMGYNGAWGTSTEIGSYVWHVYMNSGHSYVHPEPGVKNEGVSIRCMKD
jgi:uncharacterized protein (TIGR02145 family)